MSLCVTKIHFKLSFNLRFACKIKGGGGRKKKKTWEFSAQCLIDQEWQEMPTSLDGSQEHLPCLSNCQEEMGVSQETKRSRRRCCFHTQTPNHYFAFRAYHFKLSDLLQREQIFVHRKFCLVLPDFVTFLKYSTCMCSSIMYFETE